MDTDKNIIACINKIIKTLDNYDIYLICCEKDRNKCHRGLLANKICELCDCEICELQK